MKNVFFLLLLSFSVAAFSQTITEEELRIKVVSAQENCDGAHESIVLRTNEDLAKFFWGKTVRFNDASIVKFFNYTAGEEVTANVDINKTRNKNWTYAYDQKATSELLVANGVRVAQSYSKQWINARQDLVQAESVADSTTTTILELYCPHQSLLELIRTGKTQSIEFLITGYTASLTSNHTIKGILTKVNVEKPIVKCSNGHEFDKVIGYKFCPKCGETLK